MCVQQHTLPLNLQVTILGYFPSPWNSSGATVVGFSDVYSRKIFSWCEYVYGQFLLNLSLPFTEHTLHAAHSFGAFGDSQCGSKHRGFTLRSQQYVHMSKSSRLATRTQATSKTRISEPIDIVVRRRCMPALKCNMKHSAVAPVLAYTTLRHGTLCPLLPFMHHKAQFFPKRVGISSSKNALMCSQPTLERQAGGMHSTARL